MCYSFSDVGYSVFVFKQKTAYEMRISDWSSDVCSSDLRSKADRRAAVGQRRGLQYLRVCKLLDFHFHRKAGKRAFLRQAYGCDASVAGGWLEIGRASCRERVCQYV